MRPVVLLALDDARLAQDGSGRERNPPTGAPLSAPHFEPRAKNVIFLFMNGGVSQVDTFDPKPALEKYDGQPMPTGTIETERRTGAALEQRVPARRPPGDVLCQGRLV